MKKLVEGKITTENGTKELVNSMTITDYPTSTDEMLGCFEVLGHNEKAYMLSGMFAKLIVSAQQPLRDKTRFENNGSYTVSQVVESLASSAKVPSFKSQIKELESKIAVVNGILEAIKDLEGTEPVVEVKTAERAKLEEELTNLLALEAARPKKEKKAKEANK